MGAPPVSDRQRRRAVVAVTVGNAFEWYDLVIYGYFASVIARLFFPVQSEIASLLLAFGTFGVTFFIRPLGAVALGGYADRHGRKAALQLSIGLMAAGTAMIALLPTYGQIGMLAPLLLVVARMLQGFSAGGEFGSATAFLAEQSERHRGFYASWQFASQGLTIVMATATGVLLSAVLDRAELEAWGWRIPFALGLIIGPIGYYIRRRLSETAEFHTVPKGNAPLRAVAADAKERLAIAIGVVVLGTVITYTILFLPTYAVRQLGLETTQAFAAAFLTGVIQLALVPVIGALSDRTGRIPIATAAAVAALLVIYPTFVWLAAAPSLARLLVVQAVIGVLTACYIGALPAFMSELFPARIRTTGLSVSYALGVAIFGGMAPFFNAWLIEVTGSNVAPSLYVIAAAVASLAALGRARALGFK